MSEPLIAYDILPPPFAAPWGVGAGGGLTNADGRLLAYPVLTHLGEPRERAALMRWAASSAGLVHVAAAGGLAAARLPDLIRRGKGDKAIDVIERFIPLAAEGLRPLYDRASRPDVPHNAALIDLLASMGERP